jgi:putative drug exporter of the RND superfamily
VSPSRRERLRIATGRMAATAAWLIVRARVLVAAGWVAVAVLATLYLPGPQPINTQSVGTLIPQDAPALQAELRALKLFQVPLLSRVAVVQRDPRGLSPAAQARAVERALAVDQHRVPGLAKIEGALPIANTLKLFPSSRESSTTIVTFLYINPELGLVEQRDLALAYARQIDQPGDALIGITGPIPAQVRQGTLIERALPWVEVATVVLIALIVGLALRAVGAPLAALGAAGVAYLVSVRVVTWVGVKLGVAVPQDLEPVIVVLLLGIVTDYSIFFLFGVRDRLRSGQARLEAAEATTANFLPIIVTAGLTVAAGTAALAVSNLTFIRAFGPALALTVLISLIVAVTCVPALLAIFGGSLFWPGRPAPVPVATDPQGEEHLSPTEPAGPVHPAQPEAAPPRWRDRLGRLTTAKPAAFLIATVLLVGLLLAGSQLSSARLGFSLISGLPSDTQEHQAAEAAGEGFVPGILSPTEILLEGQGIGSHRQELSALEAAVGREPGVAAVLGPREEATGAALLGGIVGTKGTPAQPGIAVSKDGNAARLVVILESDPLGGVAIQDIHSMRGRFPELLGQAGLPGVRVEFAGDTALADDTVQQTLDNLGRIAAAALAVDLLLLVLFLRSLVAPLYLLAASVLALLASLGITTWIVQHLWGYDHLTYYVPFAVAVLLVSLGSDYNIFIVGRMWEEARLRPLRDAVAIGARRATRPITLAGLTLAGSFALLALVPIGPFREFALAMSVGVLVDSFLVRSLLVPALVSLFGRISFWPSRGPATAETAQPEAA